MTRDDLIAKARQLGAQRAELLTRPELRDEIIRLSTGNEEERRRARGWFGVARDLVASVVSQGLNLPDTADLIRGVNVLNPQATAPVATVTLAEIYAAQGHVQKALDLLDEVLAKEPDHEAARRARERWSQQDYPDEQPTLDTLRPEPQEARLDDRVPGNDVLSNDVADPTMPPAAFGAELLAAQREPPATDEGEASWAGPADRGIGTAVEPEAAEPEIAIGAEPAILDEQSEPAPVHRSEPESDQLVVLHDVDGSLLCDWELMPSTMDRLLIEEPMGVLILRTIEVVASWDGPVVHQREFELDQAIGQRSVAPHGESTAMRAVLGWRTAERFIVVALGAEFSWSRAEGAELLWAPPHSMTTEAWHQLGSAAAERLALGAG